MNIHAWLAGLWDGDGTRYITKRKHRNQVDYFIEISSTSFLEIRKIIEVLQEVFGSLPHNVKAYLRKGRKHYTFEARMDSKSVFKWFDDENLNNLAMRYPLEYLSGLFWAEGSLVFGIKRRNKRITPAILISVKPDSYKKSIALFHKNTYDRLAQALIALKNKHPRLRYTVSVDRKGRDKGKRTYLIRCNSITEPIITMNPSNWKIFRWLYIKGKISLLDYIIAYSLDYSTFNKLLGRILLRRVCPYSYFDTWFYKNVLRITDFSYLKFLANTSARRTLMLFNEIGVRDYIDVLKYAQEAVVQLEKTPKEMFKKLILDALHNVYGGTAKLLLKLLKVEYRTYFHDT